MNINDYKDGNGNVEVSEQLISDIVDGVTLVDGKASKGSGQWFYIPATGGFTGRVVYRKSDTNLVSVEVSNVKHDAMAPLLTIATLPAGYRPPYEMAFNVVAPTTGHVAQLYINKSGLVRTPQNNTLQSGVEYEGVATYAV